MSEVARGARTNRLPWILVVILALVVVFLLGVISQQRAPQTNQPAEPAPQSSTDASTPPEDSATPGTDPSQARPEETMDPELKQLLERLPRRDPNDVTAQGDVNAPVVMIEWADYRCPFCAVYAVDTAPQLQKYVDDGTLRVEFRDLPLFGEDSERAATAARAAGNQGKFWEFHDALFAEAPRSGHADVTEDDVRRIAQQVGVADLAKFDADRTSPAIIEAVQADAAEARQIGISGTPFFIVNYEVINGAQPVEVFVEAIENAKRG